MAQAISVETVSPRLLAAVRVDVPFGGIGAAWKPALDKVWAFLGARPGLRDDGHNVFLYHPGDGYSMPIDFGVEVVRRFESTGEVCCASTPGGRIATAMHVGPYQKLADTHDAVRTWAAANGLRIEGRSWEIYGDPVADPEKLETRVCWLLD